MSDSARAWSRRRWLLTIVILFLAQAGMIFFFAERSKARVSPQPSTAFRFLPAALNDRQIASRFFASDPTLFAAANLHGVAQRGWTRVRAQNYDKLPEPEEPDHWLTLDANRLATGLPVCKDAKNPFPFEHVAQTRAMTETLWLFPDSEAVRTQSVARLEGGIAARQITSPIGLHPWPHPDALSNTVVQVGVNAAGEVTVARLLARCGLTNADWQALAMARTMRFRPVGDGNAPAMAWGKAVFEWQTVCPPPSASDAVNRRKAPF